MITNLIVFLYILFLLISVGFLTKKILAGFVFSDQYLTENPSLDYLIIFGFIFLTAALGFISLFSKIGLTVHLIIFTITFTGIIINRRQFFQLLSFYRNELKKNVKVFTYVFILWPFLLLLLLYSASSILIYDTGLYHAQYIQWIQEYKALPGLAWIHSRFAFNSHFHLTCAFFSFSFLDIRYPSGESVIFYPLNSFFILVLTGRCIYSIYSGVIRKDHFNIILYGIIFILTFFYFGSTMQSPTPDIISAILIFYIFSIALKSANFDRSHIHYNFNDIVLLCIIFVLPTFKLSGAFVALLVPFIIFRRKFSIKIFFQIVSIAIFIMLPFFIRNAILSGWVVYPLPAVDLFSFDWKIPRENVQADFKIVKAWAKVAAVPSDIVLNMKFREWFPLWWENLNDHSRGNNLLINIMTLNLISPVLFLLLYIKNRKKKEYVTYAIVFSVIFCNLVFWFFSAPDPRFATGFLFFNAALIVALIFKGLSSILSSAILVGCLCIGLLWAIEIPVQHRPYFLESDKRRQIVMYPKQLEIPPVELIVNTQGNLTVARPLLDDRCFNIKIPCAPYVNTNVMLRGRSIEDGFKYPVAK